MGILSIIKKNLSKISKPSKMPTCMNRLQNMKDIGFGPKVIFDGGASVGYWSWEVGKMFTGAQLLVIEPNKIIISQTEDLLSKLSPRPVIEQCAVGSGMDLPV